MADSEEFLEYQRDHEIVNTLAVARAIQGIDDPTACRFLGWSQDDLDYFENSADEYVCSIDVIRFAVMVGKKIKLSIA